MKNNIDRFECMFPLLLTANFDEKVEDTHDAIVKKLKYLQILSVNKSINLRFLQQL